MKIKAILIIICLAFFNCSELRDSSNENMRKDRKHLSMLEIKEKMNEDIKLKLKNVSRQNLMKLALATEAYHKEVNDKQDFIGGLHDYIFNLSNDEIISKIKEETCEHQEINTMEKLEKLISGSCFDRVTIERERISREYFKTLPSQMIKNCALGVENYHRSMQPGHIYGGLHDYINTLSDMEITEYVMMEVNNHPKIVTNFHTICGQVGHSSMSMQSLVKLLDIEVMKAYAMTLALYNNEKMNEKMEDLEDYIKKLDKSKLIDMIMTMLNKYPEMNTLPAIEEMRVKYRIEFKN